MLEKLPAALGRALRPARAGVAKLAYQDPSFGHVIETVQLTSPEFAEGHAIPRVYTADGDGISPPLLWSGVPEHAKSLLLLIEDADSPTRSPLVHAVVWLRPELRELPRGALGKPSQAVALGRNSMLQRAYLPPDPPRGHGVHRYAFQLFACDVEPPSEPSGTRRSALARAHGHVLAKGWLVGTYARL